MAVPKRKMSKSKIRSRKASHKKRTPVATPCPDCGAGHESHRACPSCGHYRGRQVLTVNAG